MTQGVVGCGGNYVSEINSNHTRHSEATPRMNCLKAAGVAESIQKKVVLKNHKKASKPAQKNRKAKEKDKSVAQEKPAGQLLSSTDELGSNSGTGTLKNALTSVEQITQ
jgi:hypothetical protein